MNLRRAPENNSNKPQKTPEQRKKEMLQKRMETLARIGGKRQEFLARIDAGVRTKVEKAEQETKTTLFMVDRFTTGMGTLGNKWMETIFTPEQQTQLHLGGKYNEFLKKYVDEIQTTNQKIYGMPLWQAGDKAKIYVFTPSQKLLKQYNLEFATTDAAEAQHYRDEAYEVAHYAGFTRNIDCSFRGKNGDNVQMDICLGSKYHFIIDANSKNFTKSLGEQFQKHKTLMASAGQTLNRNGFGTADLHINLSKIEQSTISHNGVRYELQLDHKNIQKSLEKNLDEIGKAIKLVEKIKKQFKAKLESYRSSFPESDVKLDVGFYRDSYSKEIKFRFRFTTKNQPNPEWQDQYLQNEVAGYIDHMFGYYINLALNDENGEVKDKKRKEYQTYVDSLIPADKRATGISCRVYTRVNEMKLAFKLFKGNNAIQNTKFYADIKTLKKENIAQQLKVKLESVA